MKKDIVAIIPARMGSSRFPGKPMKEINGIPMIEHVYKNVKKCRSLSQVIVATCDDEIFNHVKKIGGLSIMTNKSHERASDRCAEALSIYENERGIKCDIMVMVQGDEPMVKPEMIEESINPMLNNENINIVNLASKISSDEEFVDPNCIKVVLDKNNDAIFFSRQPIPSNAKKNERLKQVCIIPFKREYLYYYSNLRPTPLESSESIDMLRIIEHGEKVRIVPTKYQTHAVDTLDDLKRVESLILLSQ